MLLPPPEVPHDADEELLRVAVAGRAVRAVAIACAQLEQTLLCGFDSEEILRQELGELSQRGELLLQVRLGRHRFSH